MDKDRIICFSFTITYFPYNPIKMEAIEYDRMHALEHKFWWYRALHAITLERTLNIALPSNAKILDAGCGTGGLLHYLSERLPCLPAHTQLYGLEFNPHAAANSQGKCTVPISQGNINHMPFQNDCFDIIICNDVLYHQNADPIISLQEFLRVLKPGGSILLHNPAYSWMRSAHDTHVHTRERYTAQKYKQLLKSSGFVIQQCAYWNSLLFPLMAAHRLTQGKNKTSSDVEIINPLLDALFYRVISLEKYLARFKLTLPFGGSVWARASKPLN